MQMPFACWDGNGLSGGGGLASCCCLSTARELTQLLVAAGSLAKAVVALRVGSCSRIRKASTIKKLVCYTRHFSNARLQRQRQRQRQRQQQR